MSDGEETKPKAPAGWYPHPSMAQTRRYWDGAKWTDHIAPDDTNHSPAPAKPGPSAKGPSRVDPTFAWAVALVPLVALPIYYLAPTDDAVSGTAFGVWIITAVLASADSNRLAARGVKVNAAWVLLLPLIYLIDRTKKADSTPAIPLVWVAGVGTYLAVVASLGFVVEHDSTSVELEIASWAEEQSGSRPTVTCPEIRGRDGDTFDCTARYGDAVVPITVTLTDDGSYKWAVG